MQTLLTSWKEIANYVGKGVRTIQRWENRFGFPVHRPNGDKGVVLAIPEEIDAWVRSNAKTLRENFEEPSTASASRDQDASEIFALCERAVKRNVAIRDQFSVNLRRNTELIRELRNPKPGFGASLPSDASESATEVSSSTPLQND